MHTEELKVPYENIILFKTINIPDNLKDIIDNFSEVEIIKALRIFIKLREHNKMRHEAKKKESRKE